MDSLTGRTARAARWRFAASIGGAALQFAVGVLLARLLTPTDFGAVALMTVVLGFLKPLSDLGVGTAVLQRPVLTPRHVRAAFTCAVLVGFVVAALVAAAAPLAAIALGDPNVTPMLRVLSAALGLRNVGVVAEALLARRLDFKNVFFIEAGSSFFGYGALGGALALSGFGAWSLVWAGMLQAVLATIGYLIAAGHSFRPLLGARELGELLHFGVGASLGGWVSYLALNGDNFVVGRWMGAASLGLYSRAYSLMNVPFTYASGVLSGVLFPAFAQVQDEPARLQRGFLLATQLTALVAAPAMATLAVAAPHLVPTLYGDQWSDAVAPLQILCMAGYFRALYHLGGVLARSVGRVYRELALQVVYALLVIGGTLVASPYGLPWVAAAVSVSILYMFVATTALALQSTGVTWRIYFGAQRGAVITGLITGGAALAARVTLEAQGLAGETITFGILAAASVPWTVGVLQHVRRPEFEPVRAQLPAWSLRAATIR